MKVYHGSYTEISEIDLSKCESYRDFGKGFYVTSIREQAEYWAQRKGRDNKTEGVVSEFDFIESSIEHWNFEVLRFGDYTEEWLDFVVMNRNRKNTIFTHRYDIVEGPVADDKVAQRIDAYLEGAISKKTFLEELKFFRHTHQICLCTQRSLQALDRITKRKYVGNIDNAIVQSLVIDYNLTEANAIEYYFDSNTYSQVIDENTGFYRKPWEEIYSILLRELKLTK